MINYARIGVALLHPLQRRILEKVQTVVKTSPTELAQELGEPIGNVSYHVGILAGRGKSRFAAAPVLELVETKPRRGALEHFYSLAPEWRLSVDYLRGQLAELYARSEGLR